MKLFGKKEVNNTCCCTDGCTEEAMKQAEQEKQEKGIKILGAGCAKCNALEASIRTALTELDLHMEIEHVTDFAKIASYGVMTTPAFVLQGRVVSYGQVLSVDQVKTLLKDIH